MIRGILIDLGKTIVSNEYFSFKKGLIAIYNNFESINNKISLNHFIKTTDKHMHLYYERDITNIEIPFSKYISLVLNDLNITSFDINNIEDCFLNNSMVDTLIPNITAFLKFIKNNNIPIIIVSNSTFSKRALYKELINLNINNYFTDLISSSDILYRKPSQEIFDYAFNKISKYIPNAHKSEIMFIGNDYKLDALGSLNAGLVPAFYNVNNDFYDKNIYSFNNYLSLIDEIYKRNNSTK